MAWWPATSHMCIINKQLGNVGTLTLIDSKREFSEIAMSEHLSAQRFSVLVFYEQNFVAKLADSVISKYQRVWQKFRAAGCNVYLISNEQPFGLYSYLDSGAGGWPLENGMYAVSDKACRVIEQLGFYDRAAGVCVEGVAVLEGRTVRYVSQGAEADPSAMYRTVLQLQARAGDSGRRRTPNDETQ